MDILPFAGVDHYDSDEEEATHQPLLVIGEEAGWCLFSIDVRNTYGLPFEVTFERDQEGGVNLVVSVSLVSDIIS
jgi:hypothetical protein